jgi:hypothetical protein
MSYPPDAREIIRAAMDYDAMREEQPRPLAWRKLAIAAGITAACLAGCAVALAEEGKPRLVCGTQAEALKALKDRYGEIPAAMGVTVRGEVLQLLTDPKDGSWTLLLTAPADPDRTCVLVGGNGWETLPQGDAT